MQHPINIKIPVTNTFMEIPFKWTAGQMLVKKFSNLSGCPNDENRKKSKLKTSRIDKLVI